jgi:AraC family transcriptional regulator, transcriptional activator of pobA
MLLSVLGTKCSLSTIYSLERDLTKSEVISLSTTKLTCMIQTSPQLNGLNSSASKRMKIISESNIFNIGTIGKFASSSLQEKDLTKRVHGFEILWIQKSGGNIHVDGQQIQMKDNAIYCFATGHICQLQLDTQVEGYYIYFGDEFIRLSESYTEVFLDFERNHKFGQVFTTQVTTDVQSELLEIAKQMHNEFTKNQLSRHKLLKALLHTFILYISVDNISTQLPQYKDRILVNRFVELLRTHYIKKKMVSDYASDLGVTPSYLNCVVKKVSGYTASYHIQQQIIMEAKRQTIYSGASMKQIAYCLEFQSPAHFSKFFKKNCGVSYSDFRKLYLSL